MTKHKAHPKKSAETHPVPQADAPPAVPMQAETAAPAPATAGAQPAEVAPPEAQPEVEQLRDRHLRLAAEFDNFRKRTQRERAEAWGKAQAEVIGNILDALDDLGRVAHLDAAATTAGDVVAGVELVERKLLRVLTAAGLERVGAPGDAFDPNTHEAVLSVPAPSADQDHQVASVLQPGYRFGGALLRPARVSVYLWQEPAAPDAPQADS